MSVLPSLKADPVPFPGNSDPGIIKAKTNLVKLLQSPKKLEDFRAVLQMTGSEFKISDAVLEFCEKYFGCYSVLNSPEFTQPAGFSANKFPLQHAIYDKFINANSFVTPTEVIKKIPENVINKVLHFYSTCIAADGSVKIFYISNNQRETVGKKLIELVSLKISGVDLFDEVAILALDNLFWFCYPQYLIYKGDAVSNRKILNFQAEWEKLAEPIDELAAAMVNGTLEQRMIAMQKIAEEQEGAEEGLDFWNDTKPVPQSIWEFIMALFGINTLRFDDSKECLVGTILKPKMRKFFQKYLKANNIEKSYLCYESFARLELKTKRVTDTRALCLERFLKSIPCDPNQETRNVSFSMAPVFVLFFQTFIAPGSQYEITVPKNLREPIITKIENIGKDMIKINIFDPIIDVVVEGLYQSNFKDFVQAQK